MKFIIQPLNCSMEEALEVVKRIIDKKGSKFTFLDKSLITYNIQRRVNKNSISYKISKVPFSFMVFPEEDRWVIYNTTTNSHIKVFNSKKEAWKEARRLARGSEGKAILKDKDTITTDYRSEPTRRFEELLDEYLKKSPEELEKIGKDLLKAEKNSSCDYSYLPCCDSYTSYIKDDPTLHKILTIAEEYISLTKTNIYSLVFYLSRNIPIRYRFSSPEIHSDDIKLCLHFLKIKGFLTESEGIIKVQNKYKFTEFSEARLLHDNISKFEYLIDGRYLKRNYLNISTALYVYRSLIQAEEYFTMDQYLEKFKQWEVRFKDSEIKYMFNKLYEIEPTKYFRS